MKCTYHSIKSDRCSGNIDWKDYGTFILISLRDKNILIIISVIHRFEFYCGERIFGSFLRLKDFVAPKFPLIRAGKPELLLVLGILRQSFQLDRLLKNNLCICRSHSYLNLCPTMLEFLPKNWRWLGAVGPGFPL